MIVITMPNAPAVATDLERIRNEINDVFTKTDPIQTIVATTILTQMDQELDPDGVPWPDLSPSYAIWKARYAPGSEIGRLDGHMKDFPNMRGVASVSGFTLTISYGVDPLAIYHAVQFTEGGIVNGTNQPPRPFWGLNTESIRQLDDHFATLIVV